MTNYQLQMKKIIPPLLILALLFYSCKKDDHSEEMAKGEVETLFSLMSPEKTGFDFINGVTFKTMEQLYRREPLITM